MIQIVTQGPELLQSAVPKALPLIAGDHFDLFHPFARLEELGLGLGTFFARLRRRSWDRYISPRSERLAETKPSSW